METKSIKGSSGPMVASIFGFSCKSLTARPSAELTNGDSDAIDNPQLQFPAHSGFEPVPESLFHPISIGGLAHKRGAMHAVQTRKEGQIMMLEIGKDRRILRQSEILADELDGQPFATSQSRSGSTLAEALALQDRLHSIIHQTKPGDNQLIKRHGWPPQGIFLLLSLSTWLFFKKTRTSGDVNKSNQSYVVLFSRMKEMG
jgi:hypothetical protein